MVEDVKQGFFADWNNLDAEKYLRLDYYFETTADPEGGGSSSVSRAVNSSVETGWS